MRTRIGSLYGTGDGVLCLVAVTGSGVAGGPKGRTVHLRVPSGAGTLFLSLTGQCLPLVRTATMDRSLGLMQQSHGDLTGALPLGLGGGNPEQLRMGDSNRLPQHLENLCERCTW